MAKQVGNGLYFTIQEVATVLHCSTTKITAYVRQGRLKTIRQGQARLISEQELRRLQAKRTL